MIRPSRELGFFDLFECHAAIASEGARELLAVLRAAAPAPQGAARLHELRDEGGLIAGRYFEELHLAFGTPIERGAIERLVKSLQGALNMLEEAAARVELYRFATIIPEAASLAELLRGALADTEEALADLRRVRHAGCVRAACDRIAGHAREADRIVRRARARLFKEEVDPSVIVKWGDFFDQLGVAARRCQEVARVIEAVVLDAAA